MRIRQYLVIAVFFPLMSLGACTMSDYEIVVPNYAPEETQTIARPQRLPTKAPAVTAQAIQDEIALEKLQNQQNQKPLTLQQRLAKQQGRFYRTSDKAAQARPLRQINSRPKSASPSALQPLQKAEKIDSSVEIFSLDGWSPSR